MAEPQEGLIRQTLGDKLIRNGVGGLLTLAGLWVVLVLTATLEVSVQGSAVFGWFLYCGLKGFGANLAHGLGKWSYNLGTRK